MKIECPVCHEEISASQLTEVREFDCPHCHYRIEMDPFAASLMQLFPVLALILFILVFTILKLFLPEQTLVIVFLVIFCVGARLHWSLWILRYLGLLKFRRKVDDEHKL
ncbi:hypothetical protein [Holdemania massiliensis]|uniref:hypothetical protein n=1 Tax=Holdemania massiliensis TaxID=1468449 RepID=UPI0003093516|nr:hypothetical protein [Holdemania massiliensis]